MAAEGRPDIEGVISDKTIARTRDTAALLSPQARETITGAASYFVRLAEARRTPDDLRRLQNRPSLRSHAMVTLTPPGGGVAWPVLAHPMAKICTVVLFTGVLIRAGQVLRPQNQWPGGAADRPYLEGAFQGLPVRRDTLRLFMLRVHSTTPGALETPYDWRDWVLATVAAVGPDDLKDALL
ncbi:MAG: hypothetical protein NXI21_09200 [Alphaproteobacteria bacterium]|nr:hypothetical protein [Alphaproteobacteria bacterium]